MTDARRQRTGGLARSARRPRLILIPSPTRMPMSMPTAMAMAMAMMCRSPAHREQWDMGGG